MKTTNKMAYIVHTDHLDALQDNPIGIHSVWMNEDKANKKMEKLNEEAGDDIYSVEEYPIMK